MGIEGIWFNELGSIMQVQVDGGTVTGTYASQVGEASGEYSLLGLVDTSPSPGQGQAAAWSVAWENSQVDANSVTCWSGQYQPGDSESISALWLLSRSTVPQASWESTFVGQDVFTRNPPDADAVRRRLDVGVATSHPLTLRERTSGG